MIRHSRVVSVAATLLCLGLAFVVIDSLSTVKYTSQRLSWKRTTESHQCPWTRSHKDSAAASRLFSISDFSSHPYSVYYGTSGSTAQQNFGQNDDFNDVYGYGPDDRMQEEPIHPGENTQLRSMQDIPLMDGRRGATVFGRRYNDERPHHRFYEDPRLAHERERMFHEERLMEDHHVMGEMDSLLHEREHLRNELDAVMQENMHLQMNGPPRGVPPPPPAQNQRCQGPCMGQDRSSAAVDNVMTELQNMRRTAQSFNTGQRQDGNFENSSSSTQSVENIKSELNDIEQEVQNLEQEKASPSAFVSNHNGYDASTGEASQPEFTSVNGSTPGNVNSEGPMAESTSPVNGYANGAVNGYASGASNGAVNGYANGASNGAVNGYANGESNGAVNGYANGASNGAVNGYANESANGYANGAVNGSAESDHVSKLFDEEYEVVIKAQLTKKAGSDGPREPVERQIDVNKEASRRETTTVWGGTFGRKHV